MGVIYPKGHAPKDRMNHEGQHHDNGQQREQVQEDGHIYARTLPPSRTTSTHDGPKK